MKPSPAAKERGRVPLENLHYKIGLKNIKARLVRDSRTVKDGQIGVGEDLHLRIVVALAIEGASVALVVMAVSLWNSAPLDGDLDGLGAHVEVTNAHSDQAIVGLTEEMSILVPVEIHFFFGFADFPPRLNFS